MRFDSVSHGERTCRCAIFSPFELTCPRRTSPNIRSFAEDPFARRACTAKYLTLQQDQASFVLRNLGQSLHTCGSILIARILPDISTVLRAHKGAPGRTSRALSAPRARPATPLHEHRKTSPERLSLASADHLTSFQNHPDLISCASPKGRASGAEVRGPKARVPPDPGMGFLWI